MSKKSWLSKVLSDNGFGYAKPYYMRFSEEHGLVECVSLQTHPQGMLAQFSVSYPDSEGGPQISPPEIQVMYRGGVFGGVPSGNELNGFWSEVDASSLVEAISTWGFAHLKRLGDCQLMLDVNAYLSGDEDVQVARSTFPALAESWVRRGMSPVRTMSRAAYLNLAGRFGDALQVIERIPVGRRTPFDEKIASDARAGSVRDLEAVRRFLASVGATSPRLPDGVRGHPRSSSP